MNDLEEDSSLVVENVSDFGDIENDQKSDYSGDCSSKTPSPIENLALDPNFVCNTTEIEQPSRITRSKRCKSVGDLYEKAIAAQFARKSVVRLAHQTQQLNLGRIRAPQKLQRWIQKLDKPFRICLTPSKQWVCLQNTTVLAS